MNFLSNKKNIAFILFIVSIVLILLNVILNRLYPDSPAAEDYRELTSEDISQRFRNAILNYGFDESWIIEKKKSGDDIHSYIVKVPKDVPIALLVKEIADSYNPLDAEVLVEEKKINGNNYLRILSNDHLKLISDFVYTEDIFRKSGSAGTLILNVENLSGEEFYGIIRSPQLLGFVLVPSKASVLLSKKIIGEKKEVIVLLNDDIPELEYKLGGDFSPNRIKNVIRSLIGAYPRAAFYLIDAGSSVYNSSVAELIITEFSRRNIKIIPTNMILYYNGSDGAGLNKVIQMVDDQKRVIAVSAENYASLNSEFDRLRKIGFKFVNPSSAVN